MKSPKKLHVSQEESKQEENVWPPPPTVPPLESPSAWKPLSWKNLLLALVLTSAGAVVGVVSVILRLPPLTKIYTGFGAVLVIVFLFLSVFLGWFAWKQLNSFLASLLWLCCGIVSIWTIFQFILQISFL